MTSRQKANLLKRLRAEKTRKRKMAKKEVLLADKLPLYQRVSEIRKEIAELLKVFPTDC